MKVAAIQFEAGPDAVPAENVERAMSAIRETAADADLAVLPEYFATDYFPAEQDSDAFDLAVEVDGGLVETIRETAAALQTGIVAPIFERADPGGRYYSSAVLVDGDGDVAGTYRKLHPFQRPGYNERYYFAPGDRGAPVFDVGGLTVGVMICFDRHFPEIARVQALRGADVIAVPTCSFGEENRDEVWARELTGIAVSNSVYVVGVNRAGEERGKTHFGASTVIGPDGSELLRLGADPETGVASVDPDRVTAVRNATHHLNEIRDELLPDTSRL